MCSGSEPLQRGLERLLCEGMKVKLKLQWLSQNVGDAQLSTTVVVFRQGPAVLEWICPKREAIYATGGWAGKVGQLKPFRGR